MANSDIADALDGLDLFQGFSYGELKIIGEMALLDNERRSATCIADTHCRLFVLDRSSLKKLEAEAPLLAYRFMRCLALLLSRRLRRTSGMLVEYLA